MEAPTGQKRGGTGRSTKVITDKNKRSRGDFLYFAYFLCLKVKYLTMVISV